MSYIEVNYSPDVTLGVAFDLMLAYQVEQVLGVTNPLILHNLVRMPADKIDALVMIHLTTEQVRRGGTTNSKARKIREALCNELHATNIAVYVHYDIVGSSESP